MPTGESFDALRSAYEGVESPAGFDGPDDVAAYRRAALEKSAAEVRFVTDRLTQRGTAVEVACGNGRLLIALAEAGAIERGLGIDIATSRIAFARGWAGEAGLRSLEFAAGDALDHELGQGHALALCVTGAFGYFNAYVPGSGERLLARLRDALAPGGLLVLELYQHPLERELIAIAGGRLRLWHELPPGDPWRFYLSDITVEGDLMTHHKTFVHRSDGTIDDAREERITLYTPAQVGPMLAAAGYVDVALHDGWGDAPYDGGKFLVVTARRG